MNLVEGLSRAGEQILKTKSLSLALLVVRGLRRAMLALFAAFLAFNVFTAAVFAALIYNLEQGEVSFDAFNIILLSIGVLSLAAISWALRERTWIAAFDLERRVLAAISEPTGKKETPTEKAVELDHRLEEAVRETLRRLAA